LKPFFGGSYIFSYSQIFTLDYVPVSLYYDDWAWSYGVGAGIKLLIGADGEGDGSLYLDLKGRYLMSSEVSRCLIDSQFVMQITASTIL